MSVAAIWPGQQVDSGGGSHSMGAVCLLSQLSPGLIPLFTTTISFVVLAVSLSFAVVISFWGLAD